jgi:S1-C subfamily serine protease
MKSWMQSWKKGVGLHLIMPILAIGLVGSFVTYDFVKAMPAKAAAMATPTTTPLDDNNVGALLSLDQAMETLSRESPGNVNLTGTWRAKANGADGDLADGVEDSTFGQFLGQQFGRQFGRQFGQQMRPQQPRVEHGLGSGVIISPDGYIVTNNHVVDGATDVRVTMSDRRILPAKVVGTDPLTDLAVIKVDGHNLPNAPWGDSTKLHPGQTVLAFGNPYGFRFTVTRSIVSALNRQMSSDDAAARGVHSGRRGHQSGKLRWSAGERARGSGRDQHLPDLALRFVLRHGICHSHADRAPHGGKADPVWKGDARLCGNRNCRCHSG